MIPPFGFEAPSDIRFGVGRSAEALHLCASWGRRGLLVRGSSAERSSTLRQQFFEGGLELDEEVIVDEPDLHGLRAALARVRARSVEFVVAMGGGSVLDFGKALAGLLGSREDPLVHLEVVGGGRPLDGPGVPFLAIPTTAGTGAEVTKNAVIDVRTQGVKVSLRSPFLLARVALLDPTLTVSVPPIITAQTGFDALAQVIEPFVSCFAQPMTDALCRAAISRGPAALRRAYADGTDLAARAEMMFVSLCGGLALANAKLGAVHGFAGPLGGVYHAPHGALCARLLPFVLRANLEAIDAASRWDLRARFDELGRLLSGDSAARGEDAVALCFSLAEALDIRPLRAFGMVERDIPGLVASSARASSMKGNPIVLDERTLATILLQAL